MKKYTYNFFLSVIILSVASCNSGGSKDEPKNNSNAKTAGDTAKKTTYNANWLANDSIDICKDAGGFGNFFVSEKEGMDMLSDFDKIYKTMDNKPVDALLNSYWLSACQISEIAAYLNAGNHDGIRIYMACALTASSTDYGNQHYKNKTNIFIFPTTFNSSIPTAGSKSQHQTDTNSRMHLGACTSQSEYFKAYNSTTKSMITKFDELYRKKPVFDETTDKKDALSAAIWIDKCVITGLDRLLKAHSTTNDGAFINMGAYKTITSERQRFQKYNTQSTVIVVPTKKNGTGGHEIDWELLDNVAKSVTAFAPQGGFNHGELCPQVCN